MEEIWVDIKGYEGLYMVSNLGNIKSLTRTTHKSNGRTQITKGKYIAKQYNKKYNFYMIMLNKDAIRKAFILHRVVAEHFVFNDDTQNKITVNHIDGDRSNNSACNLEWTTYSENLKHAYDVLHRKVSKRIAIKRPCKSIDKNSNMENIYGSIAEASRNTKISETQIRRIIANECINEKYFFEYI